MAGNAMEDPAATGAPQSAPSAGLNSVRALTSAVPPPHSAGYTFDPDRFTDITGSFWKVSTNEETAGVQNSRCIAPGESVSPALGHHVFDPMTQSWKRGSPKPHPAARVKVEIDRNSYRNRGRTKEMRSPLNA